MNLEEEILYAKALNWARIISQKADRICEERKNDVDLMIQILNGDIFAMAQDEFAKDKAMGKYDSQNMPIEVNL
jgi:hypothetical protein